MRDSKLHNEAELLKRIVVGDIEAFRELFLFYKPRLYTAALRIVGDAGWAQDVYQDVFLRVWLKRTALGEVDNFGAWLFTIARNRMFDALKQLESVPADNFDTTSESHPDISYDPAYILQNKEVQKILSAAIARLPDRQRATYNLIKGDGMSRTEAAATMNVSPETVKWNLDQAMRSIRAYCLKHLDIVLFAAFFSFF